MKDRIDAIIHRRQAEYLESLTPARSALLERMEKFAAENDHPIADPEVAQFLRVLVAAKRPRRIFEVGTNIGYSVVVMGSALDREATIERPSRSTATRFEARASSSRRRHCRAGSCFTKGPHSTFCPGSKARSISSSSIA